MQDNRSEEAIMQDVQERGGHQDGYRGAKLFTQSILPKTAHRHPLSQRLELGGSTGAEGAAAAANAMVNGVRLILMILICVLLVKLRAPRSARRGRQAKALGGDSTDSDMTDCCNKDYQTDDIRDHDTSDKRLSSWTSSLGADTIDSRTIRLRVKTSSMIGNKIRELGNKFFFNLKGQSVEHERQRRKSEPKLPLNQQDQAAEQRRIMMERRRRHSDTCLAHLKLPPGPMGLPFLGYLPFVGNEIHLTLTSLSERYGPIYQIFLGGIRVVVLNDAALIRQAFKQPVFSGRPDTQLTRILQGYGIVNSDGALWKEQRAFLHSALRKLGAKSLMSGSNGLQSKIQNQVGEFVNDLKVHAADGKACQIRPIVARAVSSVVGSIVMNLTYKKYEEKEKFDRLIELMQEGFRLFTIAMPLDFIPIFRFLPGVSYAYKKMKRNRAETSAFFQGVADEHRKYLNETFNLGHRTAASLPECSALSTSLHWQPSSQVTPLMKRTINSPLHPKSQAAEIMATPRSVAASIAQGAATAASLVNGQLRGAPGQPEPVATDGAGWPGVSQSQSQSHSHSQPATSNELANRAHQPMKAQHDTELDNIVARDLVDAYLVQQKRHEKDGKENYFSDQQLVQIMSDIFSAGLETVTSTIEWSILFLILNTECQEQIQSEIDRVIGRDRMPQLDDLSHMPYTEATIYEVLRRSNVITLGNAHATLDDASIAGYRIPKGTQVLPNLYGIHMNPKLWDEPEKFQPNRFIVNEKAQKPDYFIPFSVGRRMCLGDVLAKMEVFLFLVGLLQKYDLSVAEEDRHCPPQIKGTIGVSNSPASFRVAIHSRDIKKRQPSH